MWKGQRGRYWSEYVLRLKDIAHRANERADRAIEQAAKVAEEYPALPSVGLEKQNIADRIRALKEKP